MPYYVKPHLLLKLFEETFKTRRNWFIATLLNLARTKVVAQYYTAEFYWSRFVHAATIKQLLPTVLSTCEIFTSLFKTSIGILII